MTRTIIQMAMAILLVSQNLTAQSQSGQATIGGSTPDPSAVLDMQSTDKGFLWPRLSTAERNAIVNPARGLVIFNTVTLCLEINQGTPSAPQWERAKCRTGIIASLDCGNASVTGPIISIPYTGGNGGVYEATSASSTGVTGFTAALPAGNYAASGGSLSWEVSGVPSSVGTATFNLSAGGYTCSVPFTVIPGTITSLNCAESTITGSLSNGHSASCVSASIPYTGGDSGLHSGQTVVSTGITGLTATLSAGNFASGAGNLSYIITGTPASAGTASFPLNIGGQTCLLDVTITAQPVCRAKVNATNYIDFMCHNLGAANTSADPFTPSWEIHGGYWQWGRSAEAAAGPTASDPKDSAISGWNTTDAATGSWTDGSKTSNDPCPSGYRVPSKAQWDGVVANNTKIDVGSFSSSATNYGAGKKIGGQLMLPAAGFRFFPDGALYERGNGGVYWSSTEGGLDNAWSMDFSTSFVDTYRSYHTFGLSVRCIADIPGTVGSLNCSGSTITGTLNSGQIASGVSASVPYTDGDAGPHTGQTVTSTGVTGLTATLSAGSFVSGAGALIYAITGTPAITGTASFTLNIGGQNCTLDVTVTSPPPVCRAKVNATDYKDFMCYNLGAANTSADPFTPSWEINGGYWQWGRSTEAAAGPTASDPKDGTVSGWNTTDAANGSWADGSKTANDPCPSGYRIPTKAQWEGIVAHNASTNLGTFTSSATNYGTGKKFGDQLMLPAAGYRNHGNGALTYRGYYGNYWSSAEDNNNDSWYLYFNSSPGDMDVNDRTTGLSVRCIAE